LLRHKPLPFFFFPQHAEMAMAAAAAGCVALAGGNNLAHTILGVDWNEQLGAVR
jgi:hypothetical protein